jgi:hypothetical protein
MTTSRRGGHGEPNRRSRHRATVFVDDPITGTPAELRRIQPFAANKEYICPGCNQEIRSGVAHIVIVPLNATDLRRHWHSPCYERAQRHGHR